MHNKIKNIELFSLLITLILSSFMGIGINILIKTSQTDSWISILLCLIISIPTLIIFYLIFNYEPNLPIHDKIFKLFGKYIGFIINLIIITSVFITGICYLFSLINFIKEEYLENTPLIIIGISFIILIIYANLKGIKTITRLSFILLVFDLILLIIPIFNISSLNDFNNLKPILLNGLKNPLIGSFKIIILNINNIFLLTIIPKNKIMDNKKVNKCLLFALLISLIIMFLIVIITITSLGINLSLYYEYPEYIILKKVNIFNFFNRVENILIIEWINGTFISLTLIIYFISSSIKKGENKYFIIFISLLLLIGALTFKNSINFKKFYESYLIDIKIIVFFILLITSFLAKKKILKIS